MQPTIYVITPKTNKAKAWVGQNVPLEDWQWMGEGFCVEHRYIDDLVQGMMDEGLVNHIDFTVDAGL